jgi:hypothetical protein
MVQTVLKRAAIDVERDTLATCAYAGGHKKLPQKQAQAHSGVNSRSDNPS